MSKTATRITALVMLALFGMTAAYYQLLQPRRQRLRRPLYLHAAPVAPSRIDSQITMETATISFGRVGEELEHRAAIFIGSAHEVVLGDAFEQAGWEHAASLCGAILAVADNDVESPGWSFEVVSSMDGGRSWEHAATIPKPHYTAYFEALTCEDRVLTLRAAYDTEMTTTGGWMQLVKNVFSRKPRGEVFAIWTSKDAGRT